MCPLNTGDRSYQWLVAQVALGVVLVRGYTTMRGTKDQSLNHWAHTPVTLARVPVGAAPSWALSDRVQAGGGTDGCALVCSWTRRQRMAIRTM